MIKAYKVWSKDQEGRYRLVAVDMYEGQYKSRSTEIRRGILD